MVFHKARYWDLCFFLIFINDLPTEIQECMTDIYADDTTLSTSGTPNDQVEAGETSKRCRQYENMVRKKSYGFKSN